MRDTFVEKSEPAAHRATHGEDCRRTTRGCRHAVNRHGLFSVSLLVVCPGVMVVDNPGFPLVRQ